MLFCGVDIGTTRTKACLLDKGLEIIAVAEMPGGAIRAGRVSAESWVEGFCGCMDKFKSAGLLGREKICCSITTQGGSFAFLDSRYRPVSAGYSWTGRCGKKMVERLKTVFEPRWYYRTTGWQMDAWLMPCKIREFLEGSRPKDYTFISTVPELILAQLAGKFITDVTNAQMTGMCDFKNSMWSSSILKWAGVSPEAFPPIVDDLIILAEDVRTPWGKVTFASSSHDQYAAMEAAGLKKDKGVMLGTGAAWVINGRTTRPLYNDKNNLIYPGRDVRKNNFGFIIGLGQVGRGLDLMLKTLAVDNKYLSSIQKTFDDTDVPSKPVRIDILKAPKPPSSRADAAIRRYMEWAGSSVYFLLEKLNLAGGLDEITMTGGGASGSFWPQVVADITGIKVRAIDFAHFTAYGAALHAASAYTGQKTRHAAGKLNVRTCKPHRSDEYQRWHRDCQVPVFEKIFNR